MGQAKQRGTMEDRIEQATARARVNAQSKTFTIISALTGKALAKTPSGMSLDGVTFANQEDAKKFIFIHWENPLLASEVSVASIF